VKPQPPFDGNRFPHTDYFFHPGRGRRDGYSGDDSFYFRRHNLGREYLVESARERAKEMVVLGIVLFAAAWPMIAMIIEVARFYKTRH
jgi:hypothetical protein